ncbi:[protein-PII] uridylyltransferase [Labedaea rhizosphaerae]|uniref:Bifunctional uridylyltransferase/uridylyl-removing enzyme n=1 Tax=Labedaea rhizosphaerae TaxID=598644 RepID=A0A4R6SBS4_LABRH|nr:[protein-PII] uridylyltransferase [Labedaea rhizosphaerae]TDP97390.1 UTP--GlnB (protein PII) uridylyltransferase GlnD [Labedaea rhizosphaerae]
MQESALDLVQARDRLLGSGQLPPRVLREALADLHEFWLTAQAAHAGIDTAVHGVALVALGGLGRRELVPHSDLDLLLVHDKVEGVDQAAELLWYPLWNARIGLDHAVRTVAEAVEVAAFDLRVAVGLLDARHLAGDGDLTGRLIGAARQRWRAGVRARAAELVESARQRWRRAGEVAHVVEPDLKHGKGGLRDIGLLTALADGQLVDRPSAEVRQAHELLLNTRTELRRLTGRAVDVVRPQDGDEVAAALGLADRFELSRALSGAGRTVSYALEVAMRDASAQRRGFGVLRRKPDRRPLAEGVVLADGEVALARDADPSRDPGLLLRVAAAAAKVRAPIAPGALSTLADTAQEPRAPWSAALRQDLVAMLGAGEGLIDVVEALERTGLWARLVPEWGAVRDLPPRDAAHVWTVDRHLIRATANAAKLVTSVARPDLLLLGALLHDIGKGRDEDHSVVGAALAEQVGTRLGLSKSDVDTLQAMVRHHLLLPHTATRRDVEEPATVQRVAETLGGDVRLLELLHALTEADSLATGPGAWTPWKASLVADLVRRCAQAMAGEHAPGPEPLDPSQRELAERVAASGQPDVLVATNDTGDTEGALATVTLGAPDRPGLLSLAAGVLALNALEVHAATALGERGVAVLVLTASPRFGSLPDAALLREQFRRALGGTLELADKLAAKERDYRTAPFDPPAPRVRWFDNEADGGVVLELRCADRIGLLHSIATALERCDVDLWWARAATMGGTAIDSFCLGDEPRSGAADPDRRAAIEAAVLAAAADTG